MVKIAAGADGGRPSGRGWPSGAVTWLVDTALDCLLAFMLVHIVAVVIGRYIP